MALGSGLSVNEMGGRARTAARGLAVLPGGVRNAALHAMPAALERVRGELQAANAADVGDARAAGLAGPLLTRLEITDKVFAYMKARLEEVSTLPDPVGRVLEGHIRPNGLRVQRVSVPIGVIGMIYESRPNVTTDAASVCLKSGNAVILRGGSESLRTNVVLADAMIGTAATHGLPEGSVQIIRTPDREAVTQLLHLEDDVDVIIPRGGKGLISAVARESRIPVIKHYEGICHLYLAEDAPSEMAVSLSINSKCQRVEVCNALETVLVDAGALGRLLDPVVEGFSAEGVEVRGCARACALMPSLVPATEEDWGTEYLAPVISLKVVDGLDAAVHHINTYGSGHTDGIVTQRMSLADAFVAGVDSASVLVNASTRLSGGGDYGLGAVVGISTDKLHARGPVGPTALTSYKWVAYGDGHIRD
ncbi:MAG: glutamate-5-semialdehyde dehydrogenase [Lentisphaerae bacterium]|jgi:glutamate-5-semialdehyde dehydrogenase|nr:glutamate-5-semialdehyde dehydrogenase [Lentisphaerota bacterium]MBT5605887.1 glutamate-5-semialdehyde dehydrogenase [Lentisphaerota bacterium]MBT7057966.1 glutamate-5-semialdehyde dehydrogenase [Lentisphaerota bacterium]MBT7848521.1 glutamate-5-semialdehyde dehydrogenase [Lentisphaerota bacterium]